MKRAVITYCDLAADTLGRRTMILDWGDPTGVYRLEPSRDGKPIGYRRAQCFFTTPESLIARLKEKGFDVVEKEK